ncbi:MAG: ABC transporter ATP-binding protein [Microscillaceae bacterium]|jgi:ABC-2 type transport system ATP-binding protein|nr:ABC transporter ATP-binding protein [Microscillaceae bacterium]
MIEIKEIAKKFNQITILDNVCLEIETHSCQALLGANGAGKSTLVHILSAIMQWDSGEVWIDNEPITIDSYKYRHKVGYVFEKPIYIEKLSAQEYLSFVAEMYNIPKKDYKAKVEELLAFFELPQDNKKYIEHYSKGMKNKVSLAAALIHQPKYLILDEPFDGVDFLSIQKICKLFRSMVAKGATILITSHQYDVIAEVADKFAFLQDGEIKFNATMTELEVMAKDFATEKNPVKAYLESLMVKSASQNQLSWL